MIKHIKTIGLIALSALLLSAACSKGGDDNGNDNNKYQHLDKVSYAASDEIFNNPERGWYIYNAFNFKEGDAAPSPLSVATVRNNINNGYTIIHNIYHMYEFVDKELSQEFLDVFEANMNAIREAGAKCLLRFAYSNSYDTKKDRPIENSDAPFDIFERHVAQLKPLLQKHGDVLYVMEAGFIGAWGEWYYTSHYTYRPANTPEAYAPRRQVLDKLLDAVPADRMICVRYPAAKLNMFGITTADSVTLETAFSGSDLSRVAAHNDCFVASSNDVGTFSADAQRDYWEKETKYYIMGGETCSPSAYSGCENTIEQMEKYHYSYLNRGYHTQVISGWRTEKCYDDIDRRLGYRLALKNAYFSKTADTAQPLEVVLEIENNGFAAPMNPRDMEIVFAEKGSSAEPIRIKTNVDPRYWFAGETHTVELSLNISSLSSGKTYEVFLNLPDPKPALNNRWEYSIRLANEGVWNSTTGYNKLHEITVQ